ncbi:MAG: hypothetical protein ACJ71U_22600 [Terriglobales bacterium]
MKKIALEIEIRVPFMTCQQPYELIITHSWMKKQQFGMDREVDGSVALTFLGFGVPLRSSRPLR